MSNTIYLDHPMTDEERRNLLYQGQLFLYSQRASVRKLAEFTRGLIEEAFAPLDPQTAQHAMPVDRFAEILGKLKPGFIHHPESKQHLRAILEDFGCDLEKTYFDLPRLRSSTANDYLTSGIAYAWHPHRDTWFSAPQCQLNWWLPVYEFESANAMAFHPPYWNRAVPNDSSNYNYYVWNQTCRGPEVAKIIKDDSRTMSRAKEEIALEPQLRLVCPVGGMMIFSAAQMHSSVPNTSGKTRFSIDFRTVHLRDVSEQRGAPRVDEACTGTTMRDYLRCTDLARIPEALIAMYDDGTAANGKAIYQPDQPGAMPAGPAQTVSAGVASEAVKR